MRTTVTEHCIESTKGKTLLWRSNGSRARSCGDPRCNHSLHRWHIPVISYSNPSIGGEFLETTSKEIQDKEGQALTGGYISLQSESHPIEFKNIEVLEF